jgi:tetratricopeptide (TPR) repeat protein
MRQIGLRASTLLEEAFKQHPDDVEALRMRSWVLATNGRRHYAVALHEKILQIAPSYEPALGELVQFAIQAEDYPVALDAAEKAIGLNPGSAELHERLAFISIQLQDWPRALQEAQEALHLNPFRRFARMFLVQCLLHRDEMAQAETEQANLLQLYPDQRESLGEWFAGKKRTQGR